MSRPLRPTRALAPVPARVATMPKQAASPPRRRQDFSSGAFSRLRALSPEVAAAYETLAHRARVASGLGDATVALLKLAVSVGQRSWRGVHVHARKALELGVEPDVLRHVAIVALPTVGLHASLDALRWIEEIIEERGVPGAKRKARAKEV